MKSSGKFKRGKEGECICIVHRNHQRSVIVEDHSRNIESI